MAGNQHIVVYNMDKVLSKLYTLENKIQGKVIRKANRVGAKHFLLLAMKNVPVKSGRLKRSLKIKTPRAKKDRVSIMIGTGEGLSQNFSGKTFYGAFVNYGTKNAKANPFLTNAFRNGESYAERLVIATLEQGMKSIL